MTKTTTRARYTLEFKQEAPSAVASKVAPAPIGHLPVVKPPPCAGETPQPAAG